MVYLVCFKKMSQSCSSLGQFSINVACQLAAEVQAGDEEWSETEQRVNDEMQ